MSDMLGNVNLNQYLPLRDVVFNTLREAILHGDLKPGERLMEKQLAEKMGVSRTPVREAIRKLELEGLVVMIPRKGAQVSEITIKEVEDVLEVRAALEGLASRLAAKRMSDEDLYKLKQSLREFKEGIEHQDLEILIQKDVEFHDMIFKACGNEKLVSMVNNLREQIHRFRVAYLKSFRGMSDVFEEHLKLVEAIEQRDTVQAEQLAKRHIDRQEEAILNTIRESEGLK